MLPALRELPEAPVNGVRIWSACLDALSHLEIMALHEILSTEERERAARFHFERDRKRFVAARGLLRSLLGEILEQPAAALLFEYGAHGKPALADPRPIHFNLSHSSGWAMFVLADREVGIDLENSARLDQNEADLARLAARVLSARELKFWQAIPQPAERRAMFLRAWTRKEAYAKATGAGVFQTFEKIEVIPETNLGLTSDWLLYDLAAPEGFAAALALRRGSGVVRDQSPVFAPGRDA